MDRQQIDQFIDEVADSSRICHTERHPLSLRILGDFTCIMRFVGIYIYGKSESF
jgi:hypothetical protein